MDTSAIQRRRWIILGVLVVGLLAIVIDNTVLNVALKTIASPVGGLGASQSQLEWAINSYTLVFAGLLFTFGVVGDRIGRKRVLMVGLALFGIGSLLSAYSHSPDQLIAARAAMGLGGAAVMPQTLSIIANVFEPGERSKAIGIWTSAVGIGVAIGPVLGGLLLTHFWWGSVFLINVPVTAVGLVAAFFLVPDSRNPAPGKIDFLGVLGSVLGLVLLIYGVVQGGDGASWLSAGVLAPLLGGLAVLALFVWYESRIEHPSLDVRLFKNRTLSASVGSIALLFFGMGGVYFFTSFYLQNVRGYSPLEAGALAVPFALAQFLMAPRSAALVHRYGVRAVGVAGMLAERGRDRRLRVHRHLLADLDRRGALLRAGGRARPGHPGRDRERDGGAAARAGRRRVGPVQHRAPGRGRAQRGRARLDPRAGLPHLAEPDPVAAPGVGQERGGHVDHRHPGPGAAPRPGPAGSCSPRPTRRSWTRCGSPPRSRPAWRSSARSRCPAGCRASRGLPSRKSTNWSPAEIAAAERELALAARPQPSRRGKFNIHLSRTDRCFARRRPSSLSTGNRPGQSADHQIESRRGESRPCEHTTPARQRACQLTRPPGSRPDRGPDQYLRRQPARSRAAAERPGRPERRGPRQDCAAARRPGRPRSEQAEQAILDATLEAVARPRHRRRELRGRRRAGRASARPRCTAAGPARRTC